MIEFKVILHTFLKKVKPRLNTKVPIIFANKLIYHPEDDSIVYLDVIENIK